MIMGGRQTCGQVWMSALRVVIAAVTLLPALAAADTTQSGADSGWQFNASLYAFLPSIGGSTIFPIDTGGSSVNITASQILNSLNLTFMGAFDAHKGPWGAFTDLIYVDLGASKSNTNDFTIGNIGIPGGTTADLHLNVKSWVWTLAGEYRISDTPALKVDLLLGTRYLDLTEELSWSISGNLGSIVPAGRSGTSELGTVIWDGIIGVKGRAAFGADRQWLLPFYLDGGTGDSNNTWQAAAGIAYAFHWGTVDALWRYLEYDFSGTKIKSISFNGPMIGATFRW
jgi:hypothetical protein